MTGDHTLLLCCLAAFAPGFAGPRLWDRGDVLLMQAPRCTVLGVSSFQDQILVMFFDQIQGDLRSLRVWRFPRLSIEKNHLGPRVPWLIVLVAFFYGCWLIDTWSRNTFTSNFALHLTQISIPGESVLILLVFGQGLFGPASDILGSVTAASTRRHCSIVVPSDGSSEALT